MKRATALPAVLAAITLIPVMVFAAPYGTREAQQNLVSRVNVQLMVTYTAPDLQERDAFGSRVKPGDTVYENIWFTDRGDFTEAGSKMITGRISNREILELLLAEGIIEGIRGHRIIFFGEQDSALDAFYCAVQTPDGSIIPINDIFAFECLTADAVTLKEQSSVTGKKDLISGSANSMCLAAIGLEAGDIVSFMTGRLRSRDQWKEVNGNPEYRFRGLQIDEITGTLDNGDEQCIDFLGPCREGFINGRIRIR